MFSSLVCPLFLPSTSLSQHVYILKQRLLFIFFVAKGTVYTLLLLRQKSRRNKTSHLTPRQKKKTSHTLATTDTHGHQLNMKTQMTAPGLRYKIK